MPSDAASPGGAGEAAGEQAGAAAAAAAPALQPAGVAALLTGKDAEIIPGYSLRLKIGESEKAVVYLATSAQRGHNVALKVSKTLRDEAAGRQFLEREYTAIMAVHSALVVEIYDYGVHAGFEYLAMEYLPRGDLKARIQRGVSEQEALYYMAQIAAALKVVHEAGLVHRDLKPPNVMLRENDGVALIDFGLARSLDGNTINTHTGVLLGSPYYMSPEQALGEVLDARSDFYSLGVIFYELLTGLKPYIGATAMEVLQQHVSAPRPVLPADLARYEPLLARLLARSRGERFTSADEIIAAAAPLYASATGERGEMQESSDEAQPERGVASVDKASRPSARARRAPAPLKGAAEGERQHRPGRRNPHSEPADGRRSCAEAAGEPLVKRAAQRIPAAVGEGVDETLGLVLLLAGHHREQRIAARPRERVVPDTPHGVHHHQHHEARRERKHRVAGRHDERYRRQHHSQTPPT